jgi:hypothetical protein
MKTSEHTFSVEMNSKQHVKSISISDEAHEKVLFEGNLGELVDLTLVDDNVLEFIGANGVLRVAVTESRLKQVFKATEQAKPQLRGGEL